jgi:predicted N-formylglutamate amidohydrolase
MAERLLISCEHAGQRVPHWLRPRFAGATAALASHRGIDIGALPIARELARRLDAPFHSTEISRLVVDTNRSLGHPALFSEFTRDCSEVERQRILDEHYHAHRQPLIERCQAWVAAGDHVLHLGIHSFTPQFHGEVRSCDLALLYDPAQPGESTVARQWLADIAKLEPAWRLRRNYPYRGAADGLTTSLRRLLPAQAYRGIEVEVNQAISASRAGQHRLAEALAQALRSTAR